MIRPATNEDADQIAAIYNHYVKNSAITFETKPVSSGEMAERIVSGSFRFPWLVSQIGGVVVAYAYASRWKSRTAYDRTVETSIYVAADAVGKGVGLPLYSDLVARLKEREFHCALGGIALPNEASVVLHQKLGFRKVGELQEVGWKMGRWVNVGYWQLLL